MRRIFITILFIFSTVLLVFVAAMWTRSYWVMDKLMIRPTSSIVTIHFFGGQGSVACTVTSETDYKVSPHWYKVEQIDKPTDLYNYWGSAGFTAKNLIYFGGFVVERPGVVQGRLCGILVPHWFLLLLTALIVGLMTWRWLRARRRDPNLCAKCGYDLRASPQRCPECGTKIPTATGGAAH
jgi:hypothetical protein